MFQITPEPIETEKIRREFGDHSCGAVVVFDGLVRNHHMGKEVSALAYEHHPIMAHPEGEKVLKEVYEKFPITHALAVHRVGDIPIGEAAVITMAASSHRADAFEACQYLIDEIKTRVPIWKYETYTNGSSLYIEQCAGCCAKKKTEETIQSIPDISGISFSKSI